MLKKLILSTLLAASAMAMHQGEINLNDKDLEVQLRLDMGQFNDMVDADTFFMGIHYLNADKDNSDYNEDPDLVGVNFLVQQPVRANEALTIGMGVKLEYSDMGEADYTVAPLGLEASLRLPSGEYVPFYLNGSLYYAPSALAFQDAERYLEYKFSVDAEIIDNGRLTAGYRNIDTKYENIDSRELNSAWFVGFKIKF